MGYEESNKKTFTAGGALGAGVRVKISTGKLALAGITDGPGAELGTLDTAALADGDIKAVNVYGGLNGTREMVADGIISQYAKVYTAANGKVSATNASTSYLRGIALEAAAADGDMIEVLDAWPMAAE